MKTLFDPGTRSSINDRIDRLEPNSVGLWGSMPAGQMVCHVADQLRLAFGELETESTPGLLRFKPLRHIPLYWLPWPNGVATAPEMLTTTPSEWRGDIATLHALVDRVGERSPAAEGGVHPNFGPLSGQEWARLSRKHLEPSPDAVRRVTACLSATGLLTEQRSRSDLPNRGLARCGPDPPHPRPEECGRDGAGSSFHHRSRLRSPRPA